MVYTVRDYCKQLYRLISASNPTIPLHGDDEKLAILVLNQLLQYYASTGLMLTIANTVTCEINNGIHTIRFVDNNYPTDTTQYEMVTLTMGEPTFTVFNGNLYTIGDIVTGNGIPASSVIDSIDGNLITINNLATITGPSTVYITSPNVIPGVVFIKKGRLANLDSAWFTLSGVTYPLIDKSRDDFLAAWKYEPLKGLPRFAIVFPQTEYVDIQLYPAPSQFFNFFCRGKFQLGELTSNSDLSVLPQYFTRFLLFAGAKDVAMYKGRADAWTQRLEEMYVQAKDVMEASSEVNLSITGDEQSLLNGAWRVRAGI